MSARTDRQETFLPLRDKTLTNVLRQVFVTEFGYGNKVLFAEAMIDRLLEVIAAFIKPASALKPGQVLWMAVANDGHKHARETMTDIPQVPVVLDLVTDEELHSLAQGAAYDEVRHQRLARLLEQAFAQHGVLAQNDLAALLLLPRCQVGRTIARFRQEKQQWLPYRGSVQDVGGTLSHKVEAIRLLEAGYLETEICHMLPMVHDLRSVENYVQTYKNVMKLLERGFTASEVSGILAIDERLVDRYVDIIREHHPEVLAGQAFSFKGMDASRPSSPKGQMSQT